MAKERRRFSGAEKLAILREHLEEFRKYLTQWKGYNDDREFPGDYVAPERPD